MPQVLRVEQQHGAAHPPRGPQGFAPLLPPPGLHKSPGMRADAHAGDRAAWLLNGLCAPVKMCVPSVYPRNFPVHRLVDECAAEGTEFPPLPPVTWLSAEKLEQDGIYVLEDAREMLVWVGRQVPDAVLRETFGVDHVDHIQSNAAALKQLDTPRSKSLNAFVNCMRRCEAGISARGYCVAGIRRRRTSTPS